VTALNDLPSDVKIACQAAGDLYGVCSKIDSNDWIFWFLYNHSAVFPKKIDAISRYFAGGADCATKLRALIEERRPLAGLRVLEFAAGYGRVTRHLRKVIPEAEVTACDIHPEALVFLREDLGMEAVGSVTAPEHFDLSQRFDVVFALSFFSHLPRTTWSSWLFKLAEHVAPNGLLIFTTHGESSRFTQANPDIGADGFCFKPLSEQHDLPPDDYGSTITLPSFVLRQILDLPNMRLVRFQEAFWWGHQDVYVLRRSP
jgi:SAM-dependent methyltransferase